MSAMPDGLNSKLKIVSFAWPVRAYPYVTIPQSESAIISIFAETYESTGNGGQLVRFG